MQFEEKEMKKYLLDNWTKDTKDILVKFNKKIVIPLKLIIPPVWLYIAPPELSDVFPINFTALSFEKLIIPVLKYVIPN